MDPFLPQFTTDNASRENEERVVISWSEDYSMDQSDSSEIVFEESGLDETEKQVESLNAEMSADEYVASFFEAVIVLLKK
jgi:hypothetical protein